MSFYFLPPFDLNQFYRDDVLNLFSDASIIKKGKSFTGCYGSVAVIKDDIIDSIFRIASETTSNNSEVKGLRASLSLAIKIMSNPVYRDKIKQINIFSDSQISIFGLRDYIYKWRYNPKDRLLYGTSKTPIANQNLFVECHNLLSELIYTCGNIVRLFHQSGHVDNSYNKLADAALTFSKANNVMGKVDLNFIRYISTYNNYVDNTSRSILRHTDIKTPYIDPISFIPQGKINKIL